MFNSKQTQISSRVTGLGLIIASAVVVFTMAHHPTGHGGGLVNRAVHATMMIVLVYLLYGFTYFAIQRGITKPLVLAGIITYGINTSCHLVAASISGFVSPGLISNTAGKVSHDLLLLCWEINQTSAGLGVFAIAFSFLLFGMDLLFSSSKYSRVVGILGILAGLCPAAYLLFVSSRLDVPTAFGIYLCHAIWTALVGVVVIRDRGRQSVTG